MRWVRWVARRIASRRVLAAVFLPIPLACTERDRSAAVPVGDEASGLAFVEVARERGLDHRHDRGASGDRLLFEVMGGGVAWLDVEGDGDLDIFIPGGQAMTSEGGFPRSDVHRLYRNDRGRFTDVTTASGLDLPGYGLGAAVADVDNDGDPDLYLIRFGPNALLLNDGAGRFLEKRDAGVEGPEPFSGSAAFGDLDGDGWVDLYLSTYIEYDRLDPPRCAQPRLDGGGEVAIYCGPHRHRGARDRLYLNNRDGTFRDTTGRAGLQSPGHAASRSLGVLIVDLDGDRDLDVFVASDTTANLLYRNRGDARFDEVGLLAGVAASDTGAYEGCMGIAAGDFDRDGRLDLYVTNFESESNRLYRALADGMFEDVTDRSGAGAGSRAHVGWSAPLVDFDLDGDLDLFVANGHIFDNAGLWSPGSAYRQRNLFLRHDAGTARLRPEGGEEAAVGTRRDRFVEIGRSLGPAFLHPRAHRGAAPADFDGDGDVDLLLVALDEPVMLLENRLERRGRRALTVSLDGAGPGGRDAIGARVEVETDLGRWTRWRVGGGGYLSAADPALHFGLGESTRIEAVRVTWPDGSEQSIEPPPPLDGRVRIEKGGGIGAGQGPVAPPPRRAGSTITPRGNGTPDPSTPRSREE